MAETQEHQLLAQDISYIKADILDIKKKLDDKYVSHETFDLTIKLVKQSIDDNSKSSTEADSRIIKTAMFFAAPLYAGIIALLFKTFSN